MESEADQILRNAKVENVAFLVIGDPFGATTHTDLVLRARQEEIPGPSFYLPTFPTLPNSSVEVIHNASIMNACGACGLQLYNFGQVTHFLEREQKRANS